MATGNGYRLTDQAEAKAAFEGFQYLRGRNMSARTKKTEKAAVLDNDETCLEWLLWFAFISDG
jgi:hypothetical protein